MRRAAPWLALLLLASCQTAAPPKFAAIKFTSAAPIKLAVGSVEVVQEYSPPLEAPNVEHQFPIPPAEMAKRWAQDRLAPAGGGGVARYVISQASVVETELPLTEGIRGAFTTDQAYRYDAVLEVALEIRNDRGFRDGIVTARVERSQTAPEKISFDDKQQAWYDMTTAMAADLDAQLDRAIHATLARFVAP